MGVELVLYNQKLMTLLRILEYMNVETEREVNLPIIKMNTLFAADYVVAVAVAVPWAGWCRRRERARGPLSAPVGPPAPAGPPGPGPQPALHPQPAAAAAGTCLQLAGRIKT